MKKMQRQNHEKLVAGKSVSLLPGCKYYLMHSPWLAKWRNYVIASGKNVSTSMEPENLDSVIDQLKCEKTDGLTIITENDWKCFCEEWGCSEEKGISAMIELADIAEDKVDSCKETPMSEDPSYSHDGANDRCDDKLEPPPVIRTSPEVCEECIGERASCQLMQRLNYSNQDIYVALVLGKEVLRSILEASEISFDPDRRTSKRSRTVLNLVTVCRVMGHFRV